MKVKAIGLVLFAGLAGTFAPIALSAPASSPNTVVTPDPAVQLKGLVHQFRVGDVAGLAQALIPPSKWEEARSAYELKRQEPFDDAERERFAEQVERLIAPDAVDTLMAELEPQLEKAKAQWPGALMMGMGAMHMAVASPDADLDDEQRDALRRLIPGVQRWASSTDFFDAATLRQALTLVTNAARRTGISDIEQLRQLPFEGMLDHAGILLLASKDALRLYGLDLDAVADSLHVEVLDNDGRTARVRTSVTVFGASLSGEHDLVLIDGRWYEASSVDAPAGRKLAYTME